MMGHREKLKTGPEHDLAGIPGHRWRDVLQSRAGYWWYWKNRINRRNRHTTKLELRDCLR